MDKKTNEKKILRERYLKDLMRYYTENGEQVLQIKNNKFCFPVVDDEKNEYFIRVTVEIPNGSRDDNEPFDGYGENEKFLSDLRLKEEKEKEREKKKAEKIKRDEEIRRKKKEKKEESGQ